MVASKIGYNLLEILQEQCENKVTEFQKNLVLSPKVLIEVNKLIDIVENGVFDTTKEKGDALENLTKTVFEKLKFFKMMPNLHTSSNEIDFLCNLNSNGMYALKQGFFVFPENFLVECKNYEKNVGVTYIGKFASLLEMQNKNFGIMISKNGITGANWSGSLGFIKKFYLKTNILIISFTLNDFKLLNTHSFFEIIQNKKEEIINDVDLTEFLKPHPAMKHHPTSQ